MLSSIFLVKKHSKVHSSYSIKPSAKISVGYEYGSSFIYSGEKYSLVPTMLCVRVIYSISLHKPRSAMIGTVCFVSGSSSTKMLSGFRSLCMTLLLCRYYIPSHIYRNNYNANFSGIFYLLSLNVFIKSVKVPPLANCVTIHKQFS